MLRSILVLALGLSLAGCLSTSSSVAQRDNERCAARGHAPDSDKFKDCLVQLETDRKVRSESRHRDFMERSAVPLPPRQ